ncbi:hypothetical protein [Saccharothrix variisporea]|uniref:Nucleotidyltransferase-like protein n=1 Tax=Saccharothrix variisporea TaxID=543527 RepID=A0A495XD65_9PSEU|nr:hypothetical protein [Saccharothrix variisporea]RKT70764.1 hypothetical protein DFJ66_4035 [Saccharothrix variisporea]
MTPPEYVKARAVLLDALDALGPHREVVVLVGAQAVYLHSGSADLATAPTTTDADLLLTPGLLAHEPLIESAMTGAGFVRGEQPGTWLGRGRVAVDLMVPEALSSGRGRRSAEVPVHGNFFRRTEGLEAAIVDNDLRHIGALDDRDPRVFPVRVAGPAALLVSKVVKISERAQNPKRLKPKDGLDVLRLLRAVEPGDLAATLGRLLANELAAGVTRKAVDALRELGTDPDRLVPSLAAQAEAGFEDPEVIKASVVALVEEVLDSLEPDGLADGQVIGLLR